MRFSKPKKLSLENLKKERLSSGVYKLLNRNKTVIYVGVSHQIQHRLFAVLYGRADYEQILGKMKIRNASKYYQVIYTNIENARSLERKIKKKNRI